MVEKNKINNKLEEINKLIDPYKLAYVNPVSDCSLLEKNAHFMDKDIFDKLTQNIKNDGFLSQLPFGMKKDDKFLILSGNHRLRASIKAGLENILILYTEELDKNKQLAYQISHNSLVGKDNMQILKELYDEIEGIEEKEFTGVSDLDFKELKVLNNSLIGDVNISLIEMTFQFVDVLADNIEHVLTFLNQQEIDRNSYIVAGSFDNYIKIVTAIKKKYGIKSVSAAFAKMVDICKKDIENEYKEERQTSS